MKALECSPGGHVVKKAKTAATRGQYPEGDHRMQAQNGDCPVRFGSGSMHGSRSFVSAKRSGLTRCWMS